MASVQSRWRRMRAVCKITLSVVWILVFLVVLDEAALVVFALSDPTPSETFGYGTVAVATVTGALSYLIRRRLFWANGQMSLETYSGVAVFLFLSLVISAAAIWALTWSVPRIAWGQLVPPLTWCLAGCLFLFLAYPSLPWLSDVWVRPGDANLKSKFLPPFARIGLRERPRRLLGKSETLLHSVDSPREETVRRRTVLRCHRA